MMKGRRKRERTEEREQTGKKGNTNMIKGEGKKGGKGRT